MVFSDALLSYISQGQRDLLQQGKYLLEDIERDRRFDFSDYSYLVFPFAKAYEGFLKQLLLDVGFISNRDYTSNHFRLGKVLSPGLVERLADRSVYKKIQDRLDTDFANKVWNTWKLGRNEVFHYFPHNLKSLTLEQARGTAGHIVATMEELLVSLKK